LSRKDINIKKQINAEEISNFTFEDAMALVGTPVEELV